MIQSGASSSMNTRSAPATKSRRDNSSTFIDTGSCGAAARTTTYRDTARWSARVVYTGTATANVSVIRGLPREFSRHTHT